GRVPGVHAAPGGAARRGGPGDPAFGVLAGRPAVQQRRRSGAAPCLPGAGGGDRTAAARFDARAGRRVVERRANRAERRVVPAGARALPGPSRAGAAAGAAGAVGPQKLPTRRPQRLWGATTISIVLKRSPWAARRAAQIGRAHV